MPLKRLGQVLHKREATLLVVFSLVSLGISYATSILVARILGPTGFDQYAVAVATLALLSTVAEAGVGKLSIQMLPAYESSGHWQLAAGFWRYSLALVLLISCLLSIVIVVVDMVGDRRLDHHAVLMAAAFLPGLALAGVSVDFVMANRNPIPGSIISRLIIPVATLLFILGSSLALPSVSPAWAVACFGGGSLVGATLATAVYRYKAAPQIFAASPTYDRKYWFRECLTFVALATMVSWIFKISLIMLDALSIPAVEVASFAAALETGCLILLISKSTDKYFQPYITVMIEHEAWEEGVHVMHRRRIWIGAICLLFMVLIVTFGKSILGLYGDTYVSGYSQLCLIAAGCCIWTLFSLSSSYLKFSGRNRLVLIVTAATALAMAILTLSLGYHWGATGAAMAFFFVLTTTSLAFRLLAERQFRRAMLDS